MLRRVRERAAASDAAPHHPEKIQRDVASFYEQYGEEFLHYALALAHDRELARDALQESLMRYFVALCHGEEIAAPRAWVYRVLHNYLLDRIREARLRKECHLPARSSYGQQHDIERECFQSELLRLLRRALTAREYDCVRLRTEGLRYQEIAATLDVSSGAVGAMMHRALRKLRNLMIPERSKA
ncbi:MAG: RNA polymerase sigma factor [Acidobacteriaceae bacterium]|nr:RNA polymerase sigma factor [Acidobacteriaceae bacterium]